MAIEILCSQDESAWDVYVTKHPRSTFFHLLAWRKLIHKVYERHLMPIYLVAKENTEIKGILPLYLFHHWFFGKKVISIPYASTGGPCADSDLIEQKLIDYAIQITIEKDALHLEIRDTKKHQGNFININHYTNQILQLNSNPDILLKKMSKNVRRDIKNAQKNNVRVDIGSNNFQAFYDIYSLGQRNLGTPIHHISWIKGLLYDLPEYHFLAIAYYRDKPAAVQLVRKYRKELTGIFGYMDPDFKDMHPNHLLNWELAKFGYQKGYADLNFGRSRQDSGVYEFKRKWNTETVPFYYHHYKHKAKQVFDTGQANPSRQKFAKLWQKLPVAIANHMGPFIRSNFP